jgi:hypothetical protein
MLYVIVEVILCVLLWLSYVYCCGYLMRIVVVILCVCIVVVILCVLLHCVRIAVFSCTLDAGLLARSQYMEGPATGHLATGFSWFPSVYK